MIGVLIEFDVLEGEEQAFIDAWERTTEIIYQQFGSLGSRLHKEASGLYVAYAQWPNKEQYQAEHIWSETDAAVRAEMRNTLVAGKPKSVRVLGVVSDLLKSDVARFS